MTLDIHRMFERAYASDISDLRLKMAAHKSQDGSALNPTWSVIWIVMKCV